MELSKFKYIQRYMNPFELYYRRFELHPQIQQLFLSFTPKMEEIFETLETADIYMNPSHSIIKAFSTGILEIHSNIRMDQISVNSPTKTPVNSNNTETLVNLTNT